MKPKLLLTNEFVEYIPNTLEEGTIYVSVAFGTVAHRCCCGCGNEVVTPLSPTDWKLTFDGQSISLYPSIGNWSFPCQSHYWIRRNRVRWAPRWTQEEIRDGRAHDSFAKEKYFGSLKRPTAHDRTSSTERIGKTNSEINLWERLKKWWLSRAS